MDKWSNYDFKRRFTVDDISQIHDRAVLLKPLNKIFWANEATNEEYHNHYICQYLCEINKMGLSCTVEVDDGLRSRNIPYLCEFMYGVNSDRVYYTDITCLFIVSLIKSRHDDEVIR